MKRYINQKHEGVAPLLGPKGDFVWVGVEFYSERREGGYAILET